ncbi:MAG: hypothetical protein ABI211_14950, partial [Vicinamibacterales bacterium]
GESLERRIHGDEIDVRLRDWKIDAVEWHSNGLKPAAAVGATAARDVDEDASHHLCRDAEKMLSILPARPIPSQQPQAHFVHEPGRLERRV